MTFDWTQFLQSRGIEYVTSGPNVWRGRISVCCPFCGTADPSHHMAIGLNGEGWRCFRNHDHKGRNPTRLVQALIGCTHEQAHVIVNGTTALPSDFLGQVQAQLRQASVNPTRTLTMPYEFQVFKPMPSAKRFVSYLLERGFRYNDIWVLAPQYNMRYCTRGPFKGRIIFPVYYQNRLVSWTGRTVYPSVSLRYKALAIDRAVGPISHYLLWYDDLLKTRADTIVLCEGPFDSFKVNTLGHMHGIVSTCFFTAEPTAAQVELLHELLPRFKHRYLMLDQGTLPKAIQVASKLSALGVSIKQLPAGVKDPCELKHQTQLIAMMQ